MTEINTITNLQKKLSNNKITSVEITKYYLDRIKKYDAKIKAYLTVCEENALRQAKEADNRRAKKQILSKLDGIPIAVKDLFCTKGIRTTAASKILENFIPFYESTVTQKLIDAGAVILGKTNLDEFAFGSSTENSAYQITKNPWDLSRVPGGSSGGSAAAVSADLCVAAIGTDTGGSIRQPASLCGIVGFKPTYGRVSRYGIIAMASSLDQAGPMTKNIEDAAIILEIIAGKDNYDSTSYNKPVSEYSKNLNIDLSKITIGVPKEFFGKGINPEVESQIKKSINEFQKLGAEIKEVSIPELKYALAVYYIIMPAEVSSNLVRYDGIRYGYSEIGKQKNLEKVYSVSRAKKFGSEPKRRAMLGSYVLSSGYYDAYYKKAQQARLVLKKSFDRVFKECDILISPVSPTTAFKIGEKTSDPLEMYMSDICTVPINPAGLPAISVPCGFSKKGLPIGMQIIGPHFSEEKIFQISNSFEKKINIVNQQPEIK